MRVPCDGTVHVPVEQPQQCIQHTGTCRERMSCTLRASRPLEPRDSLPAVTDTPKGLNPVAECILKSLPLKIGAARTPHFHAIVGIGLERSLTEIPESLWEPPVVYVGWIRPRLPTNVIRFRSA